MPQLCKLVACFVSSANIYDYNPPTHTTSFFKVVLQLLPLGQLALENVIASNEMIIPNSAPGYTLPNKFEFSK